MQPFPILNYQSTDAPATACGPNLLRELFVCAITWMLAAVPIGISAFAFSAGDRVVAWFFGGSGLMVFGAATLKAVSGFRAWRAWRKIGP